MHTFTKRVLISITLLPVLISANLAFAFMDVPQNSAYSPALQVLVKEGKVAAADQFHPDQTVTKCQFLKMMLSPIPSYADLDFVLVPYTDVPADHWCLPYLKLAIQKHIIRQKSGEFMPDSSLNLFTAVRVLYRLYPALPLPKDVSSLKNFKDVNLKDTSMPWSELLQATVDRIIQAKTSTTLGVRQVVSRAEAVDMIYRTETGYHYAAGDITETLFGNATPQAKLAFLGVLDAVSNDYLHKGNVDYNALLKGALDGLIKTLNDPYTNFYDKEGMAKLRNADNGIRTILGMELNITDNQVVVSGLIPGFSAEKAGVKVGDVIVKFGGQTVDSMTFAQLLKVVMGHDGDKVTIEMKRAGTNENLSFELVYKTSGIPPVDFTSLNNGQIADFRIREFNAYTGQEFVNSFLNNVNTNTKGIILDLRGNPGGLLDQVQSVAGVFLKKGSLVATVTDVHGGKAELRTAVDSISRSLPVVVLVDGNTASAAEVIAAALKDYKLATIVGQQTFGKGVAQQEYNYVDGSGLLLTTYSWKPPLSDSIDKKGVTPDVVVSNDPQTSQDEQLQKALDILAAK